MIESLRPLTESESLSSPGERIMKSRKVLIVDDDEVLGRVLGRVLSQQGYSVSQATTAAEALQVAQEQHPALALLDLSLPDGNGTEG